MEEFRYYSPEDVIYANLRETAARMDMVCEQELAHLHELAAEITKDIGNNPELATSLSDLLPKNFAKSPQTLPQNAEALGRIRPFRTVWQNILLCTEIRKLWNAKKEIDPDIFFPEAEDVPANAAERIAYPRSSYADAAYLRFSELLHLPRTVYTHSFPAACEEVYNGLCEYCILPLENSSEGPLNSFSRLIDNYGLKVAATCDVCAADGSRSTRFALLRRDPIPFLPFGKRQRYFEFAAALTASPSPAEILTAAQLCGLKLCRLDSRPHQTDTATDIWTHFVFSAKEGDLTAFLLYLFMQVPNAEYIGIYPHLNHQTKQNHPKRGE